MRLDSRPGPDREDLKSCSQGGGWAALGVSERRGEGPPGSGRRGRVTGQGTRLSVGGRLAAVMQHVRTRAGWGPGLSTSGPALGYGVPWRAGTTHSFPRAGPFPGPLGSSRASFCTIVRRVVGIWKHCKNARLLIYGDYCKESAGLGKGHFLPPGWGAWLFGEGGRVL